MIRNYAIVMFLAFTTLMNVNLRGNNLEKLDSIIELRDKFVDQKLQRIAKIKASMEPKEIDSKSFEKYSELYNEYKVFQYDSAFKYANKLINIAYYLRDKEKIAIAKTDLSLIMISSGMFKESLDTVLTVQYNYLNDSSKFAYFTLVARIYYDMADYLSDDHYFDIYNKIGNEYTEKAAKMCNKDEARYLLLMGLKEIRNANWLESRKYYEKLFYNYKLNKAEIARTASGLAYVYYKLNELEKSKEMVAAAIIADVEMGIKETTAKRDLAEREYKSGNIKKAYKYIKLALDDAHYYGARYRKIQISNILPIIEEKHFQEVESQKKKLTMYLLFITALVLLLISFLVIILKLNKNLSKTKIDLAKSNDELSKTNTQLTEANHIKEEYIGQFFNIISEYIDKIEKFKKTINRKIATNNLLEIKDAVDNINLKEEREELYLSFDNIFLKIFPGFINSFNLLLKDDERYVVKENQPLLPELRIIALMRLGINDPDKLAKILNYSIHTIYTYKAKIKNKALIPNMIFGTKGLEFHPS